MKKKIMPEKLADIDKHKTRKKIKDTTLANKALIARASHLLSATEIANREFKKVDLPYLKETTLIYYTPEKIIVESEREILRSKFKQLQSQFVSSLRERKFFSRLEEIEIQINNKKTKREQPKQAISPDVKKGIETLKSEFSKK